MKQFLITLFAIAITANSFAQAIKYRTFDFDSKRPLTELTEEEKKEKVLIINETKAIELAETPTGDIDAYLFFHRIIRINSEEKIQSYNRIYLPINNADNLLSLKACTFNKSGKTSELYKGDMKQVQEDDGNYLILALDGLEVGSEIEFYYIIRINANSFFTHRLSNVCFTREHVYEFISPEKLVFETKSYNGMPELVDTTYNDKTYKTFTLKNLQAQEDERYAANEAYCPRIEVKLSYNYYSRGNTKVMTFTDAAKSYYKILHDLTKDDIKVMEKIYDKAKLKKISGEEAKIRALENYMKSNFNGIESANISMTEGLKNNVFTYFQMLGIYAWVCEKENIEYELVFTSQKDEAEFDPTFESWNYLKEELIYFPTTNKYLSPSSVLYRYGMIMAGCMNQKGLFVKTISIGDTKSALNSLKFIEPSNFDKNVDNIDAEVSFAPEMDIVNIKLTRTLDGYPAANLRPIYHYVNEEKRTELVEEHLKLGIKDAVARNIVVKNSDINTDEVYKPFITTADVEVASMLETTGNDYLFKLGLCIGPQAELYQETKRRLPGYMPYPHSFVRKLIVNIPQGYEVKGLDEINMNVLLNNGDKKLAGFVSSYKLENGKLIVDVNEYYNQQEYPLEMFEQFRKVINAAADFNKLTIVLSKKK